MTHKYPNGQRPLFGREDGDRACGLAFVVLRGWGRRFGTGPRSGLLSGLTLSGLS